MKNKLPKRKSPRLRNFDYSTPYTYFITTCTEDKTEIFTDHSLNSEIIDCVKAQRNRLHFGIFCYCLMPNHLHLLLSPSESKHTVSRFMNAFKSLATKICRRHGLMGRIWQGRFYDHVLRKDEDLKSVAEYILNNPVRKGTVKHWKDYKYCGLLDAIGT